MGQCDHRRQRRDGRGRQSDVERDRPRQPGRDGAGLGSIHRRSARPGDRLAGPPRRSRVRPSPRLTAASLPSSPDSNSTRTSSHRRSCGCANRSATRRRSPPPTRGCCTGCAVPSPPTSPRPVDRCCSTSTPASGASEPVRSSASTRRSLPAVVGNAEPLGDCSLFGGSVPVTGTCVDQQAALFAEHCHACRRGEVHVRHRRVHAGVHRRQADPVDATAWSVARRGGSVSDITYCLDGQVYTVGAAVSWLIDIGVMSEPADLDRLGATVDGSGGVTFVPALAGLAAPYWKPQAKAAFTGLSLSTERGHLVRAAIDGIAAQVALLAQAAGRDLGSPLTRLRVDGGLTRSRTAAADAGRPAAGAGRGVPVAARHGARRRRVRRSGRQPCITGPARRRQRGTQMPSSSRRSAPTRPPSAWPTWQRVAVATMDL